MILAKFAACDLKTRCEKGCHHTRTNKKPSNRKLEALLSLSEVAPDAQDLKIVLRMIFRNLERNNVVNLSLPLISTDSAAMPALPIVSH